MDTAGDKCAMKQAFPLCFNASDFRAHTYYKLLTVFTNQFIIPCHHGMPVVPKITSSNIFSVSLLGLKGASTKYVILSPAATFSFAPTSRATPSFPGGSCHETTVNVAATVARPVPLPDPP